MPSTEPKGLSVLTYLDAGFERTKHAWIPTEADPPVPFFPGLYNIGLELCLATIPGPSAALLSTFSLNQGYRS